MKTTLDHRQWQLAQQRTLKYLNALGVDPVRALGIAQQALTRAAVNHRGDSADSLHPVKAAMRELRRTLSSNQNQQQTPMMGQMQVDDACALLKRTEQNGQATRAIIESSQRFLSEMPVMPPIRRTHMVPEIIRPMRLKSMIAFLFNRSDS